MSFSFGFSGDDVEGENDVVVQNGTTNPNGDAGSKFVGLPAEEHSLDNLVGTCTTFCSKLFHTRNNIEGMRPFVLKCIRRWLERTQHRGQIATLITFVYRTMLWDGEQPCLSIEEDHLMTENVWNN